MGDRWPIVPLGDVVVHRKEFIKIDDLKTYKRCRVQLHARGIVLRDQIEGARIRTKQQQVCRANEFLVAEIDAKVGGFGLVPAELDGAIVSSHYFLFVPDPEVLDYRFLGYYIKTPMFRDQVRAQGSTNYAAIRPSHVLGYTIPLPPLSEQCRIVAKIEALAEKIEDARGLRWKSAAAQELLWQTGARNALETMPEELWQPIRTLACVRGGSTPSKKNQEFWGGDIPWVSPKDMKVWEIRDSQDHITQLAVDAKPKILVEPGAVLVVIRGMILVHTVPSAVLRVESAINQDMKAFAFADNVLPEYVVRCFWALNSDILELVDRSGHDTRKLNTDKLLGFRIPVPPVDEQRRIIEYLDGLQTKVDELKALQSKTQKELDALLPSILDKAFKGELVETDCGAVEERSPKADRLFDMSAELERDYATDVAVGVLVLDDYRNRDKSIREFHQQKLAYIAKRVLALPLQSEFKAKAAGPWSADLRDAIEQVAGDHGWQRYVPRRQGPGDVAQPGKAFDDGVKWAADQLGPDAAKVRSLLGQFRRFGDAGLERWATILMVAQHLQEAGTSITRRAIQKGIDEWPGKRNKKWFGTADVNKAIDGLVAKAWLRVRGE